jgi:hypothetical protein
MEMQADNSGGDAKKNGLEKNAESVMAQAVLKLFNAYYRDHNHSGKTYDDFPDFYLFTIQRAKARNGYISVCKHRNPKLGYYWLELSVMPFMMGDAVSKDNKGEFFYILAKFIEYTQQHPNIYGDLTAEMDSDKDIAIMLDGIKKMAARLSVSLDAQGKRSGLVRNVFRIPDLCDGQKDYGVIFSSTSAAPLPPSWLGASQYPSTC